MLVVSDVLLRKIQESLYFDTSQGLEKLARDFKEKDMTLWFINLNPKVVKSIRTLGDLDKLKILKNEAEVVSLLCGLGKKLNYRNVKQKTRIFFNEQNFYRQRKQCERADRQRKRKGHSDEDTALGARGRISSRQGNQRGAALA